MAEADEMRRTASHAESKLLLICFKPCLQIRFCSASRSKSLKRFSTAVCLRASRSDAIAPVSSSFSLAAKPTEALTARRPCLDIHDLRLVQRLCTTDSVALTHELSCPRTTVTVSLQARRAHQTVQRCSTLQQQVSVQLVNLR